jgi:RNase P/RNase MRP subunit p29
MAFAFQRRRGTTSAHTSFTGLAGELTVDTTKNTVVVHNGSTAGGFPLSKQRLVPATTSGTTSTVATVGDSANYPHPFLLSLL